jgi:hypothetical protein
VLDPGPRRWDVLATAAGRKHAGLCCQLSCAQQEHTPWSAIALDESRIKAAALVSSQVRGNGLRGAHDPRRVAWQNRSTASHRDRRRQILRSLDKQIMRLSLQRGKCVPERPADIHGPAPLMPSDLLTGIVHYFGDVGIVAPTHWTGVIAAGPGPDPAASSHQHHASLV